MPKSTNETVNEVRQLLRQETERMEVRRKHVLRMVIPALLIAVLGCILLFYLPS